ncbi:MAG: ATP-grasp domain-containing protein [Alphaproteobacteria bacterium]
MADEYMSEGHLRNGRVILPYGRSVMALVAAHSLGQKGVEVIGCDSVDFTILSFSSHVKEHFVYPDFLKDEQAFIDFMVDKVKALKPDDGQPYVLMPVYKDSEVLARHKERFAPYIQVATPDVEAMERLHPKDNFARTMQELNISSPQTWLPEDEGALKALDLPFPVLIKPYNQTGGRGIHKAENMEALVQYWRDNKKKYAQKSLVQEMVEGKDYCLSALYDDGVCKASMAYRNVHRFPPTDSGSGILRETVPDKRFESIASDLMEPLGWNGVAEFDFLWDEKENSVPALIEVNTRFWGGLFQSVESGIDFPWLLYKLTVNGEVEEAGEAQEGVRTKMPYVWLVSAVKDAVGKDEDFKEIEERGRQALRQMKDGELFEGLKAYSAYLADYLGETFNVGKKARRLNKALETGRTAHNELLNSDDPYAAFGVLFILGSLIRHGELPQEVRF